MNWLGRASSFKFGARVPPHGRREAGRSIRASREGGGPAAVSPRYRTAMPTGGRRSLAFPSPDLAALIPVAGGRGIRPV